MQHEEESEASDEEDTNDKKKKKKRENVRRASREEKQQALELHRSHLLTLLAHALHCSTLADDQTLQASVLSLFEHSDISVEHDSEKEFLQCLHNLADWFVSTFTITQGSTVEAIDLTAEVGVCCVLCQPLTCRRVPSQRVARRRSVTASCRP